MCIETNKKVEEKTPNEHSAETVKKLQEEVENLKLELKKAKSIPSGKIGLALAIPGVLCLVGAILKDSNVLAFIGLGLTFWGALFFFVRPLRYVQSSLIDSTALPAYKTIDRIVADLKYKGKSYYIPPYPKEVYLPEHLKGLKDHVVFISSDAGGVPSIEELAKSKFLLANPNGVCVAPPGLGILEQIEKELRKDTAKLQLAELCETIPIIIVENLQLAKEAEMKIEDNSVNLKISDSVYKSLYIDENLKSVYLLGCPIASAVACALAKASGKAVTIQKVNASIDGQTVEIRYRMVES
ncbi:hypothetical protein KEJ24_02215 [Candidatus Bathyarchaeota archaeon]|nr:hypothetical protein [Candidatus Bathyarchaeota archaeon]